MRSAFSPATRLLNRLRYRTKFVLIGSVIAAVMLVLMFSVYNSLHREIVTARHEISGLQMLKPFNHMVQLLQQHRGLSAGVLNGNADMKAKLASVEQDAVKAFDETDVILTPSLREKPEWQAISAQWKRIREEGMKLGASENFARHTEMIGKSLEFMIDVADETELTLDPVMDTYYLMDSVVVKMPALLETLGQVRGLGTAVLSSQELTLQARRDMTSLGTRIEETLRAQNKNIAKVAQYSTALNEQLRAPSEEFANSAHKVTGLVQNEILTENFSTSAQSFFGVATGAIDQGYKMVFDVLIENFGAQLQQREQAANRELTLVFALSVLAMASVFYLGAGFYYSVMDSVDSFSGGAHKMAEGDLVVTFVNHGVDELHQAGGHFDRMAQTFRELLGTLKGDVDDLQAAAQQLASSSEHIAASSATQSDAAASMAASVQQMTVGVDNISRNAQEVHEYSGRSETIAEAGAELVESVVQEIGGIAETVNQSAATVEELGRHSESISAIVGTIKEIADQTNLLALNAAIEAARAGETGRGFAVVADEVRKLAERTAQATQEIATMIQVVQVGTSEAVVSMKRGVERVAHGVSAAQKAGETIHQVREHTRQVLDAISEITTALREQASASTDIAKNVERIARMADENHTDVRDSAATAMHLRELADTLSGAVAHFRV
jgi:methyl-accepting chemotaxis protein